MDDQVKYLFLQALFYAAWSDGSLQVEESRVLRMLLSGLSFKDPAVASGMSDWFDARPDEPNWDGIPDEHKASFLREVATVIAIDGVITHDELTLFESIAKKLNVEDAQWQQVLVDVEKTLSFD